MDVSPIYTQTLKYLNYGIRTLVHQGGQYSGKTVGILGALTELACIEKGGITTITAQSFPHLKGGALRDFESYIYPDFKASIKQYHKTDHTFTLKGGSKLEFKVFENEMAARGQKRKRLFVNEANSFEYMVWFQLNSRSEQSVIDYNPSIRFFAHEKLIGQPGVKTLYSDHRHNPFLTKQKHAEIENICQFDLDENGKIQWLDNEKTKPKILHGDYELWKVYARGITGNVTGVIFPNWQQIDECDFPEDDGSEIYAVDFGYTVDPTAIVKMHLVGNSLFIKELAYEPGLSAIAIKQILYANGFHKDKILFCEHDPDMIKQLRNQKINAIFARKGHGSVNAGIELLRSYNVFYTNTSVNLHRERGMYIWEVDKKTGLTLNEPVDRNNHLMDASRYGAYSKFLRTKQ